METKNKAVEVMEVIEGQNKRPFVGAKVFEYMDDYTAHDQGDVCIIKVDSFPPDSELEEVKDWNGVVAQGFADGAEHQVQSKDGVIAYRWKKANAFQGLFLKVSKMFTITHKNHKWFSGPAGLYETQFPQEHNLGQIRRVMD